MQPTFAKADQISIKLFAYVISGPSRWDTVTYQSAAGGSFRTHRVAGLPGDTIFHDRGKVLHVNGVAANPTPAAPTEGSEQGSTVSVESLGNERHFVQVLDGNPTVHDFVDEFQGRELCTYEKGGFTCRVPPKHYLVLGDDRDMSEDSRYLAFVPEQRIAGRVENAPTSRPQVANGA